MKKIKLLVALLLLSLLGVFAPHHVNASDAGTITLSESETSYYVSQNRNDYKSIPFNILDSKKSGDNWWLDGSIEMKKGHTYLIYPFVNQLDSEFMYSRAQFEQTIEDSLDELFYIYEVLVRVDVSYTSLLDTGYYPHGYFANENYTMPITMSAHEQQWNDVAFDQGIIILESKYSRDNDKPVISGVQYLFISNVDNPFYFDEIMANVKAWDDTDGDITSRIQVISDGGYRADLETNALKLKDYTVKLSVADTAGNTTTFDFLIRTVDVTAPVFSGKLEYTAKNNQRLLVDDIKNALTATDAFEGVLPKSRIVLESNEYSNNYTRLGAYNITYSASDASGNKATVTVKINVTDGTPPSFYKPGTTTVKVTETVISKKTSIVLTLSDILQNHINCIDDIDGTITQFEVESDNYTGNGHLVGEYQIVIKAKDTAGNVTFHTIKITTNDTIPPVFIVNNFFIVVKADTVLTKNDYISILQLSGHLDPKVEAKLLIDMDQYEMNAHVPGTYPVRASIKSIDGHESVVEFSVVVEKVASGEETVTPEKKLNLFEKMIKAISDFFGGLKTSFEQNKIKVLVGAGIIGAGLYFIISRNGKKNKKNKYKKRR